MLNFTVLSQSSFMLPLENSGTSNMGRNHDGIAGIGTLWRKSAPFYFLLERVQPDLYAKKGHPMESYNVRSSRENLPRPGDPSSSRRGSFREEFLAFSSIIRNVASLLTPKPVRKVKVAAEQIFPVHRLIRSLSSCSVHPITKQSTTRHRCRRLCKCAKNAYRKRKQRRSTVIGGGGEKLDNLAQNAAESFCTKTKYNNFRSRVQKLKLAVSTTIAVQNT